MFQYQFATRFFIRDAYTATLCSMSQLSKTQQTELARMYYVLQGLTAKEAAGKVGVSEVTFSNWVIKHGWKALKAAEISKPDRLISNLYDNIISIQDNARKDKRPIDPAEADAIHKISLTIRSIKKEFGIDVYNAALQEFFNYVKEDDLQFAQRGVDHADAFLRMKIKQLGN